MATINVKNNRDETLTGDITVTGDLILSGHLRPVTTTGATPSTGTVAHVPVYNSSDVLLGYIKIFAP